MLASTSFSDVANYANDQLIETGLSLQFWTFRFNTNKTRAGVCKYQSKRIELSVNTLTLGVGAVMDTINHEIAHALVGSAHGHNHVWRSKAIELGSNGERCSKSFVGVREKAKWIAVCPKGHRTLRHRRSTTRQSCVICCPVFNANYLIRWEYNRA